MDALGIELSRISKLFVDRDQIANEIALARRQQHLIVLRCGADVGRSYTLQLAVLTAANIATRCFPSAVRFVLDPGLREAPLLLWPGAKRSFGETLAGLLGPGAAASLDCAADIVHGLVFGDALSPPGTLRITFDGWIAKVGLATCVPRLPEREYCSLTGILAAALAMSELFLEFAGVSMEASRRAVALSLWRPDLDVSDPMALGTPVQFLPRALWVLGLGHLGNAYLWAVATLPYACREAVQIFLNDFERVEPENVETGLLLSARDIGALKTRACANWLEERGFDTRLVERRLDSAFRRNVNEPALALCGFDSNPARRALATAGFQRVVESGLGGMTTNFDTISLHTLPNPRAAQDLWPDLDSETEAKRTREQNRLAQENVAYSTLGRDDCGRYDLAGKAIAVPFVGAAAASLVVAESIRLLHEGPSYPQLKLRLGIPASYVAPAPNNYHTEDSSALVHCDATSLPSRLA